MVDPATSSFCRMTPHPSVEELTRAVHGLGPLPDHVPLCARCTETVERLREERELLRRPSKPAESWTFFGEWTFFGKPRG
jgi:hypothetical protein